MSAFSKPSELSRRSLLGYSGTTAAGAVLGTAAAAQPAQAATAQASAQETASTVAFPPGTLFTGDTSIADTDEMLTLKFSVHIQSGNARAIDPVELADLLSDFAVSRGWPAITFYGTPPPAALN
ncbi:twin-arginine translocation signal domain-containing protein [Streptomyces sp. NPDC004539]|uniref:twin-arginine translocation signal domain-containing protein n=1 Tax=Streptomyces sp. NPDC004539 TaxID=3154280 RepID=UPI0033BBD116